jgi:hypothetical protein
MVVVEGGPQGPSYNKVASPELGSGHFKRPPFEPPTELRDILWAERLQEEKAMEIDLGPDHAKEARIWEPWK